MTIPVTKHMHAGGHFNWGPAQPSPTGLAIEAGLPTGWEVPVVKPGANGVLFREASTGRMLRVSIPGDLCGTGPNQTPYARASSALSDLAAFLTEELVEAEDEDDR